MSFPPVRITVSHHPTREMLARADALAARWGWPRVPPGGSDADPLLAVTRTGLRLRWRGEDRAWHPGMLHALQASGAHHPWIAMSGLAPGQRVLDTTLGLGTDAAFLAGWTGTTVVGVELSPVLGVIAEDGLGRAGHAVEVRVGEAVEVMRALPDGSVDVVIGDPMFPTLATGTGSGQDLLRWLGDGRVPDQTWRDQALRVARRAVVLKDARDNDLLERLGAPEIRGRHDRAARYGAWTHR